MIHQIKASYLEKKNHDNNSQQKLYVSYNQPKQLMEKDIENEEGIENKQKIANSLDKDHFNNMGHISQQNLPEKRVVKKEKSLKKEEKEDSPPNINEEEESDGYYIEDLNAICEKKINKKIAHFKSEENIEKNNNYERIVENNKKNNNLNKTFSDNTKGTNIKENLNNSHIQSFFYLTTKHLEEELKPILSYYSNFKNSHNYIPKFTLKFDYNENNINSKGQNNIISKNNESIQNESLNFDINPNKIFEVNKQINIDKNNNEKINESIFNNNNESDIETNIINNYDDIVNKNKKLSNSIDKHIFSNIDSRKFYTNTIQNHLSIPHTYYGYLRLNTNYRMHNKNYEQMNFINTNGQFNGKIPRNSNNMRSNIIYNKNYYNRNYTNLINKTNKNKDPIKDVEINIEQNEIEPLTGNMLNTNHIDNLTPDNYIIKMFNRLGWICCICRNFNFEKRRKCNRCQAIKLPKTKKEILKDIKKSERKTRKRKSDWLCPNCQNINYSFRENCNICKIERKEDFLSIFYRPNQIINYNNRRKMLINKFGKI